MDTQLNRIPQVHKDFPASQALQPLTGAIHKLQQKKANNSTPNSSKPRSINKAVVTQFFSISLFPVLFHTVLAAAGNVSSVRGASGAAAAAAGLEHRGWGYHHTQTWRMLCHHRGGQRAPGTGGVPQGGINGPFRVSDGHKASRGGGVRCWHTARMCPLIVTNKSECPPK